MKQPHLSVTLDDQEIMKKLQQSGDARWLDLLYRRYYPIFRKLGKRFLQDESLIEDAIQETFKRVWIHHFQFQHRSSVSLWIRRIFFNVLRTGWRENDKLTPLETQPASEQLTDLKIFEAEIHHLIDRCVQKLPHQQQQVFIKRWYHDANLEDIAKSLNISYDTAKSHWRLALIKIRQYLKKNGWCSC